MQIQKIMFIYFHQGDYTRTGERNLAGLLKDGVNSANRYVIQCKPNAIKYRLWNVCVCS